MTMNDHSYRDASFQATIKCSGCGSDVPLTGLGDHVCPSDACSGHDFFPNEGQTSTYLPHHDQTSELPKRGASLSQRRGPALPKIDSSVPAVPSLRTAPAASSITHGGRDLDPKQAASIAHDLGLPSPGPGSGRKSPRKPLRKASIPVPKGPPSPDLPIAQECAFPPFPNLAKPKRAQTDRDITTSRPQQLSRANTLESFTTHSTASSSQSYSSNVMAKRRISQTSSVHRSRQGTIEDTNSLPSTAPSSPPPSTEGFVSISKSSFEITSPNALLNSPVNHEEDSGMALPVTAARPSAGGQHLALTPTAQIPPSDSPFSSNRSLSPEQMHGSNMDGAKSIPENPQTDAYQKSYPPPESNAVSDPVNNFQGYAGANQATTFDTFLPQHQMQNRNDDASLEREPAYKTRRPPPLSDTKSFDMTSDITPQSVKSPGLGGALSNFFRKRGKSISSRKMPSPDLNSPRHRALEPEPEPPVIPTRAEGHHGIRDDHDPYTQPPQTLLERTPSPTLPNMGSEYFPNMEIASQGEGNPEQGTGVESEDVAFDFKFGDGTDGRNTPSKIEDLEQPVAENTSSITDEETRDDTTAPRISMDSASSYGSVGFSHRTASSHSSQQPSDDLKGRTSALTEPGKRAVEGLSHSGPPLAGSRPGVMDSATDPYTPSSHLAPVLEEKSPESIQPVADSPHNEVQSIGNHSPPPEPVAHTVTAQRPLTPAGTKGRCRGCSKMIMLSQKSVSSADGRLSGRYHRECFVCRTCALPFATADFYVFEDQPYCGQHYHEKNDTLCANCGNGIEGQYFESSDNFGQESKKYHPRCLTCALCKILLRDDYFEFQGKVYCERDAFRAANDAAPRHPYDNAPSRPSPLVREYISSGEQVTKGRFPERRITKLMMT